ncbi:hypothetical protein PHYPSEUDO_010403 [Phytophthora pseudosyringae]|uniref:Uncharacterized protein n=1 Tax=Phytophthora pseudosyringae TaxID=221518 RepID=A0A8T1VBA0_9STRA|nr:hypothetical protein PHYPSEUDO_010403 [Phytophthora pseudosyringae]
MSAVLMAGPALVLSEDSSGSKDRDRCDGESSSPDDVYDADSVQQNAANWPPLIDDSDTSEGESGSGSWVFDTMAAAWTFLPLTQQTAQVALDAVRYQKNYARTVTTRLCLHYINTIRMRVSSGVASYLVSVDGCELAQVEPTGRCDIYYCRPYTYELQLSQKAIGSAVFLVQSVYKTVDQKSLLVLRGDSNLDFSIGPDAGTGTGENSVIKPADIPLQSEEPVAWQDGDDTLLQGSTFFGDKQPIAWASDVNSFWEPEPASAEPATAQPLSLRAEPISNAAPDTEKAPAVGTGSAGPTAVAIVGIVAVAVSTIAFAIALVMARWRSRRTTTQCRVNEEYSPLRSTLNTAQNTISITSKNSIGDADTKPDLEPVEFFG